MHKRVGVGAALIALALFASVAVAWPTHDLLLGDRLLPLSGTMLLGLLGMGMAGTAAEATVRSKPRAQPEPQQRSLVHCILPTAVAVATWVLLTRLIDIGQYAVGAVAGAAVWALLVSAEYQVADSAVHGRQVVQGFLQLATYSVAALLFSIVHSTTVEVNAARAGAVVGALMALRLLDEEELPLGRTLWASLGTGLLLGAVSWLLHSPLTSAMTYSLTLVVVLYVLSGLAREFLQGKLRREVVLEHMLVALAALLLLSFLTR